MLNHARCLVSALVTQELFGSCFMTPPKMGRLHKPTRGTATMVLHQRIYPIHLVITVFWWISSGALNPESL